MKFGTGYAYWGTEWKCDYEEVINKVADIGFDVLEIGADHLYHMTGEEIDGLKALGDRRGISFTTNCGPAREYDLSSTDPEVRANGLAYFKKILHNMDRIGSKSLVGAIYSFWPSDFAYTDKAAAWETSIRCLKELSRTAEELDIECALNNTIDWMEIGRALRDINYRKAVVMEPFLLSGGSVGHDIRVWRDLSGNATPEQMDQYIKDSLAYLKKCCLG